MIEDYYIPCEQYRATITQDSMDVDILTYTKLADITGVRVQSGDRVLINDVWHYKNSPLFVTNDSLLKLDRVKYKGILYEITSEPDNVMEKDHHFEFKIEAVI